MPDYKQMYLEMFRAAERAVEILTAAQQKCEDYYISFAEKDYDRSRKDLYYH